MKPCSKLSFFLILSVSVFILSSCTRDENDVIPDVYVDFTIDLQNPLFANLTALGSSDTINALTNNWGENAAGYDGNGIIVYSGVDEYFAYDRTCPYDYTVNGLSIKVDIDFTLAVCPVCGTTYSLSAFGVPASGAGKYPLKNYMTSFDYERYIRVWNH